MRLAGWLVHHGSSTSACVLRCTIDAECWVCEKSLVTVIRMFGPFAPAHLK